MGFRGRERMVTGGQPTLSIIAIIANDTNDHHAHVAHLRGCLQALAAQKNAPPFEVIVPHYPAVEGLEALSREFPAVRFISVSDLRTFTGRGGSREHHDELRARALPLARGEIIGLLEDHDRPDPHWCARVIEAHRESHVGVGGAVENGIDRPLNWAVYFCDFSRYQNPVPAGLTHFASDVNVSYKRSSLEAIRPVWQESFFEPAVNSALEAQGGTLALSREIVVYQHRDGLQLADALKERFVWGRSFGATRTRLVGTAKRALLVVVSPLLPILLVARMAANVARKRRGVDRFFRVLPLTFALSVSWSLGELVGYLTGRAMGTSAKRAARRGDTSHGGTPVGAS